MAGTMKDPRTFFGKATPAQFEFVLSLYEDAIILKAEQKKKNKEEIIKLDRWYRMDLPKKIKARGKDAHLTHEELVKCMKWKLARGKFSPRLKDLITMNTPRLCMTETKKAFRALLKKDDLQSAITALCNLKGVGPAMASVVLTAGNPEVCGFMSDECLLCIPEIESIDYTIREYLNFIEQLTIAASRLNKESGNSSWNPYKIELALWAMFIITDLKSELLDDMPGGLSLSPDTITENGSSQQDEYEQKEKNGSTHSEETTDSLDSENKNTNGIVPNNTFVNEDTNDSMTPSETQSETISEQINDVPEESASEVSNDVPVSSNDTTEDEQDSIEPQCKRIRLGDD